MINDVTLWLQCAWYGDKTAYICAVFFFFFFSFFPFSSFLNKHTGVCRTSAARNSFFRISFARLTCIYYLFHTFIIFTSKNLRPCDLFLLLPVFSNDKTKKLQLKGVSFPFFFFFRRFFVLHLFPLLPSMFLIHFLFLSRKN